MKYLFQNFPLAIILMIAILIMLFKDYRKPIIIFCCIPMIFVGVVAVMLLTGKVFNFVAIVGTLGLIGMLIKNGIVLMDEITLQINEGVEPITALIDSSQSRLRPVMMASLTTILGMIPLLSDAMFGSLAAAIMGGLLCSTLITLLFIPILYALFFKIKKQLIHFTDIQNPRINEKDNDTPPLLSAVASCHPRMGTGNTESERVPRNGIKIQQGNGGFRETDGKCPLYSQELQRELLPQLHRQRNRTLQ